MATKIPRKPLQLAWGLTLMLGWGGAALAQPQLTCQVTYAGATQTVVARPVAGADAVIGGCLQSSPHPVGVAAIRALHRVMRHVA